MDFDAAERDGTVEDVALKDAISEGDIDSKSSTASEIDQTSLEFNNLPVEIRRMIWEESLPPVVPEMLMYGWYKTELWDEDLQGWYEPNIGPIVEVDFPHILHVCYESRSVALEQVLILKQTNKVRHHDALALEDARSDRAESDHDGSSMVAEDGRFDAVMDNEGGDDDAGYQSSGDFVAAGSSDDQVSIPQHTEEVSDQVDAVDHPTEEESDWGTSYHVICRRLRPELDYIFVDLDNVTSFIEEVRKGVPWLPRQVALALGGIGDVVKTPGLTKTLEDCASIKSVGLVTCKADIPVGPSVARGAGGPGRHPRFRVCYCEPLNRAPPASHEMMMVYVLKHIVSSSSRLTWLQCEMEGIPNWSTARMTYGIAAGNQALIL